MPDAITNAEKGYLIWRGKRVTQKEFKQIPIVDRVRGSDRTMGRVDYPLSLNVVVSFMAIQRNDQLFRIPMSKRPVFVNYANYINKNDASEQARLYRKFEEEYGMSIDEHHVQYAIWSRLTNNIQQLLL